MDGAQQSPGFLHLRRLSGGAQWLHMCIKHKETSEFLMSVARLDELTVQAIVEEDTRSRVRFRKDGIMVLLKALHVRSDEMARPEDMVSMRIWVGTSNIITTREADVDPIREVLRRLDANEGPKTPGDFLAEVVEIHLDEVDRYVEYIEDAVDRIEAMVVQHKAEAACPNMADTQTLISGFMRHLGPQKPVLEALSLTDHPALSEPIKTRLDDGLNHLLRYLETLQNLRERIDILNDQVARIQDRQLNRSSYAFAVAATIFLPLGFLTGLFGVNLAGIPLNQNPAGFWLFGLLCVLLTGVLIVLFRWRKWL